MITKEMIEAAAKIIDPDAWVEPPNPDVCFCEKCRDERQLQRETSMETAQAALTAAPSSQWREIKSAPKTDAQKLKAEYFLAYCPDEHPDDRIRVIWWEPLLGGGMWYDDRDIKGAVKPTHWMPLPLPPTQE